MDFDTNAKSGTSQAIQSVSNQAKNTTFRGSQSQDPAIYFLVPAAAFTLSAEKIQDKVSYSIGTATTLIKIRPGSTNRNTEIGNDINIGGLVGIRIVPNEKVSHYLLLGASVGNVKLTSTNTNNRISEDTNEFAFTPTIGYVFDFKVAQVGIFSGMDILSGSGYKSWIYKGRPWIGLGIGVSIFKEEGKSKNSVQN